MKNKIRLQKTILLVLHNDVFGLFEARELNIPFFSGGTPPPPSGVTLKRNSLPSNQVILI